MRVALRICAVALLTAAALAPAASAPSGASGAGRDWSRRARSFARAVDVRPADVPGAVPARAGLISRFSPAPLQCSRREAAEAGASSLVATPDGFVASAVAVRTSTRVAVRQMQALLSSFGRFCLGRSLGEMGGLLGAGIMSFEVSARPLAIPGGIGAEVAGSTVLAEMTTPRELVRDAREAHRLGHPAPGARTATVSGFVFRVRAAQILLFVLDERGQPSPAEMRRLLARLHRRAVAATLELRNARSTTARARRRSSRSP